MAKTIQNENRKTNFQCSVNVPGNQYKIKVI